MSFATPNAAPGRCAKCRGTGEWIGRRIVAGRTVTTKGHCFSCHGTGRQTGRDIARNMAYNRHKLAELA